MAHGHTVNGHAHSIAAVDLNHTHNDDHQHYGTTDDNNRQDNAGGGSGSTLAEIPHQHPFTTSWKSALYGSTTGWMNQSNLHDHGGTDVQAPRTDSQLSSSQDIRPTYYALAFIMKL